MLKEKGIDAIHNTKYNNYPIKTDTYLKSRNTVQNILSQNKNITKIIDIHRDSYSDKETTASTIEIRKKALEQNYRPLIIDGIRKVMNGDTTLEELNRQLIIY